MLANTLQAHASICLRVASRNDVLDKKDRLRSHPELTHTPAKRGRVSITVTINFNVCYFLTGADITAAIVSTEKGCSNCQIKRRRDVQRAGVLQCDADAGSEVLVSTICVIQA